MQRFISIRAEQKHSVVDKAVAQWRRRLRKRVHANRQHFEQLLKSLLFRAEFYAHRSRSSVTVTFVTRLGVISLFYETLN